MNILVLSWRDPKHPLAGGAEQVMHEHMKGWVSAGHKVTLYASNFSSKNHENLDGVNIIRRGKQILGVQISAFFWYLFETHDKYELVVDQFHGIPFFTPLYIKVPILAVVQEVARQVWLKNDLPKPFNFIIGYIGYLAEPFIYFLYKKVKFMTASNSAKNDLIKIGIPVKNITIVPHGVIIKTPKQKFLKEDNKTVIFLGALAKDKGIEDALKVFSLLNKYNFKFWVVGKGGTDYVKYLKNLTKELGVKVKFWGFVNDDKKFELLARANIMINPSLLEGWGLVNIEANAMGTPVVAYRSPGLVDSVKDEQSGRLINKNTPEVLAKETYLVVSNPKKLQILSKGAIEWSNNFSWERSRKLSIDIINNITND